jgi:hypothetical protein
MRKKPASQNAWRRNIDKDIRSIDSGAYKRVLRTADAGMPKSVVTIVPPGVVRRIGAHVENDPPKSDCSSSAC